MVYFKEKLVAGNLTKNEEKTKRYQIFEKRLLCNIAPHSQGNFLICLLQRRIRAHCSQDAGGEDCDDFLRHPRHPHHRHLLVQHRRRHGQGFQVREI